jgi:hypothetical protein
MENKEEKVDLRAINTSKKSLKLPNFKAWFEKTRGPARDKNGKFTTGSGGLQITQKLKLWHIITLIIVIGGSGGYWVFQSFAYSGSDCPSGTSALGRAQGYRDGRAYTINLCRIPEFKSKAPDDRGSVRVSSSVAKRWKTLYTAAKKANITLVADSSFRSMEKQRELYNCYVSKRCNGGNYASKPGFSNHQMGEAIDIDIVPNRTDPSLTTCRNNPGKYPVFQWLNRIGPYQGIHAAVPSECWHWSPSGN